MTDERQGPVGAPARPRHPERPCLNCGDATFGEFCPQCGQQKVDVQVSVSAMVKDLLEDQFLLGKRLPHTLVPLLFRPGFLTAEVLKGRIVRYILPFKLYLASSVVFFLLLSLISTHALEGGESETPAVAVENGDSASMSLAALDSTLAALDEELEGPDMSTGRALALSTARVALRRQRDQMIAEAADPAGDDASAGAPGTDTPGGPDEAARDSTADDSDASADEEEGWLNVLEGSTGIARVDQALKARVDRLNAMGREAGIRELVRMIFSYIPMIMFLLLPAFAAVLKLLYIRHRRYYAEHMIFVLHTHAFIFAIFTLMLLARSWIGGWPLTILILWVFSYIYLAMRRVYGQSHLKTFVKYWSLGWMYFWILLFGLPMLLFASLLLLPA